MAVISRNRIALTALLGVFIGSARGDEPLGGGGPIGANATDSCISEADRASARQSIENYVRDHGPLSRSSARGSPPNLTFFPLAGRVWKDLFDFNYVDLDPTSGFLDWDCSDFAYDGHNGNDMDIRSFGEQLIGVPVYAAQDGIVIATHDGEFDMNTSWNNQPANYVIIDHGFGREAWYFHLKMNSVIVTPGQPVFAGEQIGLCASSGVSTGPHLHFEIHDDCPGTCAVFEPFAGNCRPGESGWVEQPPLDRSPYLHDFGITHENINTAGPWPQIWPRTGQIALSDPNVKIWWYGTALPAGSTWRVSFVRPNGTIATNGATIGFQNPFWRWYNWWWTYDVANMHTITGTWKVRLFINNVQVLEAPIEVVAVRDPGFNRAPEPIDVEIAPPDPQVGDVLTCLVNTSLTLDDLDYDIVRYEYVWTVNGDEVRHVTTAAHSDVLSREFVMGPGPVNVQCTVTPKDNVASGQGDSVIVRVQSSVPAVSTWGLLCLGLLVLTAGSLIVLRSRRSHLQNRNFSTC